MHTFTDAAGKTWTLSLTLGSAMYVKAKLGVDLLQPEAGHPNPDDPPLMTRLGTDELLLAEVICALLDKQFEAADTTAEEVRYAFDGATLLAAHNAFYAELMDFFRGRGRSDQVTAAKKQQEAINLAIEAVETEISNYDIETEVRGRISGALQAASASAPSP